MGYAKGSGLQWLLQSTPFPLLLQPRELRLVDLQQLHLMHLVELLDNIGGTLSLREELQSLDKPMPLTRRQC